MIDHLSLGVRDLDRAAAFYDAALAALGYVRVLTHPRAAGWGPPGAKDEVFAVLVDPVASPVRGSHIAFAAKNRDAVDAFHHAALAQGGTDDGAPGLRPQHGVGYYAAFVRDPDGHRVEAVVHEA